MMSTRLEVIPATKAHAIAMADQLRADDVAEIEAGGWTANKALWRGLRRSTYAKVILVDGELAAIFGVGGTALGTTGLPWVLTTPVIERVPLDYVRLMRKEVAAALSMFPKLVGFVDARYERAVRMLALVGFELTEPFPFGPYGVPFRKFMMQAGRMRR